MTTIYYIILISIFLLFAYHNHKISSAENFTDSQVYTSTKSEWHYDTINNSYNNPYMSRISTMNNPSIYNTIYKRKFDLPESYGREPILDKSNTKYLKSRKTKVFAPWFTKQIYPLQRRHDIALY